MADDKDDGGSSPLAVIESVAPEGWRKRVASVLFQMLAGTDKGAQLYKAGKERIAETEHQLLVDRALAQKVAEQAVLDPDIMERAKARFLNKAYLEQSNVEDVVARAAKLLPDHSVADDVAVDSSIDSTWTATFAREAEIASSDEIKDRLAAILAGELRKPGSFPRSVIREAADLSTEDVSLFKSVIHLIVDDAIIVDHAASADEVAHLTLMLSDAGFTHTADSSSTKTARVNGRASIGFQNGYSTLVAVSNPTTLSVIMYPLTRLGKALYSTLHTPEHVRSGIDNVCRHFFKNTHNVRALGYMKGYGDPTVPQGDDAPIFLLGSISDVC